MDDAEIIQLLWERSENALREVRGKYEKYCRYIALKILKNPEDADDCVNEAYLKMWNAIPPEKPDSLCAFLGKITRNLSLDLYNKNRAQKRGSGEAQLVLEELAECIPGENGRDIADDIALRDALNGFLKDLSADTRNIFMQRYWYMCSIREIAENYGIGESKVKMTLLRTREKLRKYLEKEGIEI